MDNNHTNRKIIANLYNAIYELLKSDEIVVIDALNDADIDISELDESNLYFIKDLQVRVKIKLGVDKVRERENIFEKARDILKKTLNIENYLKELLPENEYSKLNYEYRNLTNINDKTKIDLLNDIQVLRIMEQLNKEAGHE